MNKYTLSVAPMVGYTNRHFRHMLRRLTGHALLYSEMVSCEALLRGPADRLLAHAEVEQPLCLQLAGRDPARLAVAAARAAAAGGFVELNLNIGCPSRRVQKGGFGACLLAEPTRVAACVHAMRDSAGLPVSVKTRTGIDQQDSYGYLRDFVGEVAAAGARTFIIHARKAWLQGLNPRQNREVPPLQYDYVYRLKCDFPDLFIVLNGGIENLRAGLLHLDRVDGVMLGRAILHDPWQLIEADALYGQERRCDHSPDRRQVLLDCLSYAAEQLRSGVPVNTVLRALYAFFKGVPGSRAWRRYLSDQARSLRPDDLLRASAGMLRASELQI